MHNPVPTVDHVLAAFRRHTENSNPGAFGTLYDALPDDIPELCRIVQDCVIHLFWIREATYGITLAQLKSSGRHLCEEFGFSTVEERLRNIIASGPRLSPNRGLQIGGVLDAAAPSRSCSSRSCGTRASPARVRTGVALYLDPSHSEDHYVTEFWNAVKHRWQMADPQIDDVQRKAMRLTVDTTDLPPGRFLTGWQLLDALRSGRLADPDRVGFPPANAGLTYGRNKLFADFVSLTGREIPVHAWWGTGEPACAESGDDALLNRMIVLLQGIDLNDPAALDEAPHLAETHPRLRRPDDYVIPPWALEP